ncbi:hypothetical protein B0H13DRAFT_275208 [Mycena leptocephala]|nr:hypothetical protein B0H13DRAFT_275208 [Mycena leptocephala]
MGSSSGCRSKGGTRIGVGEVNKFQGPSNWVPVPVRWNDSRFGASSPILLHFSSLVVDGTERATVRYLRDNINFCEMRTLTPARISESGIARSVWLFIYINNAVLLYLTHTPVHNVKLSWGAPVLGPMYIYLLVGPLDVKSLPKIKTWTPSTTFPPLRLSRTGKANLYVGYFALACGGPRLEFCGTSASFFPSGCFTLAGRMNLQKPTISFVGNSETCRRYLLFQTGAIVTST